MSTAKKKAPAASEPYFGFAATDKARFLTAFIENMTVVVRDSYLLQREEQAAKLKSWNELLHRVVGNLRAVLANSPDRFPDDVLFDMIRHTASDEDFRLQIEWAMRNAYAYVERIRTAKASAAPRIALH
ncbi:MAG: hypothetical protein ACREE3_07095 [Stellaceae bacterium]